MGRNILAAILGLVSAWVVFFLIQTASHYINPPPVGLNMESGFSVEAYMQSITPLMFAVVLAGYAIGSFVGGLVIGYLANSKGNLIPIIIGAILSLGWVLNLIALPHPLWVAVLGFFMFIPFTILGKSVSAGSGAAAEAGAGLGEGSEASAGIDSDAEAGASIGDED